MVEGTYFTDRGRTRRRRVAVDLGALRGRLRAAGGADRAAWEHIRALLRAAVGDSTFEIWLASIELLAVDLEDALVVSTPPETVGWVVRRFGRILDSAADRADRRLRLADELERQAAEAVSPASAASPRDVVARRPVERPRGFPADVSSGGSGDPSGGGSAYRSSYTAVHNQLEVS